MAKNDEKMIFKGVVTESLPNTLFKVTLTENDDGVAVSDHTILGYLGGKLRQNNIKVLEGDNVDVEVSPYDLTRGRIVYRSK
jgi:translation initiation factor IF-1